MYTIEIFCKFINLIIYFIGPVYMFASLITRTHKIIDSVKDIEILSFFSFLL